MCGGTPSHQHLRIGGQWLHTAKVLAEVAHGQVVQETMTYSAAVSACTERPMAAGGVAGQDDAWSRGARDHHVQCRGYSLQKKKRDQWLQALDLLAEMTHERLELIPSRNRQRSVLARRPASERAVHAWYLHS